MAIFTIEINGTPICAFAAETEFEASDLRFDERFRRDLMVLDHAGSPIWDECSQLYLREATEAEQGRWDKAVARAIEDGELFGRFDALEANYVAFLVSVSEESARVLDSVH